MELAQERDSDGKSAAFGSAGAQAAVARQEMAIEVDRAPGGALGGAQRGKNFGCTLTLMNSAGMARVDVDTVDAESGATLDASAECEWVQAHRALSRLARQRARADAEEGRWLLEARRSAAHLHMGFGSFAEYVERCFGYCARLSMTAVQLTLRPTYLPSLCRTS